MKKGIIAIILVLGLISPIISSALVPQYLFAQAYTSVPFYQQGDAIKVFHFSNDDSTYASSTIKGLESGVVVMYIPQLNTSGIETYQFAVKKDKCLYAFRVISNHHANDSNAIYSTIDALKSVAVIKTSIKNVKDIAYNLVHILVLTSDGTVYAINYKNLKITKLGTKFDALVNSNREVYGIKSGVVYQIYYAYDEEEPWRAMKYTIKAK